VPKCIAGYRKQAIGIPDKRWGEQMSVASAAESYATFGGVLVGFTFSGLFIYIAREPEKAWARLAVTYDKDALRPIAVRDVTAAVFLSMVSLAVSSFLFSNLVGVADTSPGAALTALLSYGIVFALSVLSLFYSVTLMMLEHPLTEYVAKTAYWVVTIAGTVIVLRFLAGSARVAVTYGCRHDRICKPVGVLSTKGIILTLLIAALLCVLSAMHLQPPKPPEESQFRRLKRKVGFLVNHPSWPPGFVFIATAFVTTSESVYLSTRDPSYAPSASFIYWSYAASIFLVAVFAFACGRVVSPRARIFTSQARKYFGWMVPACYVATAFSAVTLLLLCGPIGRQWLPALSVLGPAFGVMALIGFFRREARRNGDHQKPGSGFISGVWP
jgi:hypothetical protein